MLFNILLAIAYTAVLIQACPYLDSLNKDKSIENVDTSKWSRFLRSTELDGKGKGRGKGKGKGKGKDDGDDEDEDEEKVFKHEYEKTDPPVFASLTAAPSTLPTTVVPSALPTAAITKSSVSKKPVKYVTKSPTKYPSKKPTYKAAIKITTKAEVCAAYKSLKSLYDAGYPAPTDIRGQASIAGKASRLAWHDAGEYDMRTADKFGMDGCLSNTGSNAGLLEADGIVATVFQPMYNNISHLVSKADFIAMLGKIAIEKAATAPMTIPFYYGRTDNEFCDGGKGRLPGAQNPAVEMPRVFETQLGLTQAEAVTLLGGHTLGHVHKEFSNYGLFANQTTSPLTNAWDETPHLFDNDYWVVNVKKPWFNEITVPGVKNEWLLTEGERLVFTNTDMFIAWPIDTTGPGNTGVDGQLCKRGKGCDANSFGVVKEFLPFTAIQSAKYADGKEGNELFHTDFAKVFSKLITLGYGLPQFEDENLDALSAGKLGTLKYVNLEKCV